MARSRMIRPEFFSDEKLGTLSRDSRLLFAGLWVTSDDYGVTKGHPAWLRSQIFPYDNDLDIPKIEDWLDELSLLGLIEEFRVNSERYYNISNFLEHQKIHNPSKARNPEFTEDLRDNTDTLANPSRDIRLETETETEVKQKPKQKRKGACAPDEVDKFADLYKQLCPNLVQIKGDLTSARKSAIKQRLADLKKIEMTPEEFLEKCEAADWLAGRGKPSQGRRVFRANLDWILKPAVFERLRDLPIQVAPVASVPP